MAGHVSRFRTTASTPDIPCRHTRGQQRRLGIGGKIEFFGRPIVIDAWEVLVPTIEMPRQSLVETIEPPEPDPNER